MNIAMKDLSVKRYIQVRKQTKKQQSQKDYEFIQKNKYKKNIVILCSILQQLMKFNQASREQINFQKNSQTMIKQKIIAFYPQFINKFYFMWKKVGKKLSIQRKSPQLLVNKEVNRLISPIKSRYQMPVHKNMLTKDTYLAQNKMHKKLPQSRSNKQIANNYNCKQEQNLQNMQQLGKSLQQKSKFQGNSSNQKDPVLMNKLKINIQSVLKIVHEMKINQQQMKNEYEEKVMQFQSLMKKVQNAVSFKSYRKVDQALQKIQSYKEKLKDFDQRREKILNNYGQA